VNSSKEKVKISESETACIAKGRKNKKMLLQVGKRVLVPAQVLVIFAALILYYVNVTDMRESLLISICPLIMGFLLAAAFIITKQKDFWVGTDRSIKFSNGYSASWKNISKWEIKPLDEYPDEKLISIKSKGLATMSLQVKNGKEVEAFEKLIDDKLNVQNNRL
jgi:hypothetical protein